LAGADLELPKNENESAFLAAGTGFGATTWAGLGAGTGVALPKNEKGSTLVAAGAGLGATTCAGFGAGDGAVFPKKEKGSAFFAGGACFGGFVAGLGTATDFDVSSFLAGSGDAKMLPKSNAADSF